MGNLPHEERYHQIIEACFFAAVACCGSLIQFEAVNFDVNC